jgi:hypothetical protein
MPQTLAGGSVTIITLTLEEIRSRILDKEVRLVLTAPVLSPIAHRVNQTFASVS